MSGDEPFVMKIVCTGVTANAPKSSADLKLSHTIPAIFEGKLCFAPDVASILVDQLRGQTAGNARPGSRDWQVLRHVAYG
jgi:DNA-binding NarL/FixJ family response regulator